VPAKLAVANDSLLLQINDRRIIALTHRRQVTPGRIATSMIVPVRRAAQDVIQVPFAHHAKAVERLVLERLHHPGDANRSTPPNGGTIGLLAIQLLAGKWRQQSRLALLKGLRRAFVLAFEHHNPAVSFVRKPPFHPTDRNPFF